ncbi:uncharacterized protein I303_106497 [Kwoniella dejecticola CBS 10117]|uniref:ATP synthase mitochondrial F1 complex assembly factor 1 n=1 Tax=Kwoniella dejecticola CBS 10117 TaxID=1296121 RepID=A0A1A5ZUJ2_9TREE|nr:ATP synthase mitochondrial F1 complex assembly factor 1 [Kwoniella dejecticola CBS 10117]OBR81475.1 ATP synthase mitochondrial F1 complex assembly factor 1 [Kwoniella dejecticola CBS 10117]
MTSIIPRTTFRAGLNRSSATAPASTYRVAAKTLSTSAVRRDVLSELENQLHPRELIERKRKEFEEKYGDKLNKKAKAEGVKDLDSLKLKVLAPSVKAALKAKKAKDAAAAAIKLEEEEEQFNKDVEGQKSASAKLSDAVERRLQEREIKKKEGVKSQAESDRAGIKPLSSIINLPLIHLTPHDTNAISQIWTAYHTSHPTLSNSFLSAPVPADTYKSMLEVAKRNPFFVLPLPRLTESLPSGSTSSEAAEKGEIKTDEYEMFYLQWIFHPTPEKSNPPTESTEPLPLNTSVIFTPLEEFKKQGEWSQPFLTLTHYTDLAQTHNLVLMRGEISPESASGPNGSSTNPGFLLSQQQAQLLALALQRFYCTSIQPSGERAKDTQDRLNRAKALVDFRERPEQWSWEGLVEQAYGGLV